MFFKPYNLVLVLLLLILAGFLWYGFCIIYHLIRFGIGVKPKLMALVFFAGSFFLLIAVLFAFNQNDWPVTMQWILNFFGKLTQ